ncbi:tetratricopeptide (TPR) repeat protein/transcriptional regulator with XRE-family HTH domain [Allocatelliglobosispora scoriae]|uniref:Tetratricopeptide (TPR) repeat protein/transcriptional regulator with XRE-family HTH domain n=1 Tax=Allocatelliglobosispora scoriae TaxID=643052 RepID=A0A841BRI6_9ACTN|nr:tetratricopeptide repeat protein [Allocatelliglobosispora scoriae]MBB5870315.1 tetratricopeptide (TPR) repeat protein/transcriptional regulator with XRE-family HTH domain [Allocatelliglobosispora scoriae]
MSSVQERLVDQLARIKELSGLSLRALARQAGLSSSSLSRYLAGQLVPPWEAVVALCRAVDRDPRPLRALWVEASKAGAAPAPRRNDLPADLADFTGREAEAAQIAELISSAGAVAIDGMAGVGKTSLAVHVAYRLAPSFPDGGLYLDLRGFTPGQEPLEPSAALGQLLSALGVTHPPAGAAERAALWRSELSRRQALVLLDNAVDADHVRPLLPGAGRSAALITSRNRLVELDGVPPVSLEPLPPAAAAMLFGQAAGVDLTDEAAAEQVLQQCGGLPLALRMAGARLRHRPGWTVAVLAERLRDSANRFDAVFGMSLKQLDSDQRRTFRLLGVVPGTDFDAPAAVALTGMPPGRVDAVLEELVDAHLAQEPSPGRFRLHDLIRRYAAELAAEEEPHADAAVRRVLDHYLALAIANDEALPLPNRGGAPGDPARAIAWFDAEYANLIACFDAAVRLGADEVVADLPPAMRSWFFRHRGTDDQVRLLEGAVAAAERLGRTRQRAALLVDLGFAHAAAGRLTEALAAYEQAEPSVSDDDELAGALALRSGFVLRDLGELEAAQARFRRAGTIFEKLGQRGGQSQALAFDGWLTLRLGHRHEAAEIARAALALADGSARVTGLVTLGVALASQDAAESRRTLQEALQLAELPHTRAWCHNYLGVALRIMGSLDEALDHHRTALELLEPLAETQLEIDFLPTYAETCRVAGRTDEALALHERTIELARRLGRPGDERLANEARQRLIDGG